MVESTITNFTFFQSSADGDMRSVKPQAADAGKPSQQSRRAHLVRLPQPTADLVNRLLAARCGSAA